VDPKPVFLIAGGHHRRFAEGALWRASIASVGTPRPSLAYVGAAAGDSGPFRLLIAGFLKRAGAGRLLPVKLCGKRPNLAAARGVLDSADAVFVSGGDVEAGMRVLEETGVAGHLKALAAQGKPFIGLSAGSIVLARSWVRWRNPDDEASAELFPCLGIARVHCDTHDEDSDWAELRSLLKLLPDGEEGWGIPAGGAVVARPDRTVAWSGRPPTRLRREGVSIQGIPVPD